MRKHVEPRIEASPQTAAVGVSLRTRAAAGTLRTAQMSAQVDMSDGRLAAGVVRLGLASEARLADDVTGFARLERRDVIHRDGARHGTTALALGVTQARGDERLSATLAVASTQRSHGPDELRVSASINGPPASFAAFARWLVGSLLRRP